MCFTLVRFNTAIAVNFEIDVELFRQWTFQRGSERFALGAGLLQLRVQLVYLVLQLLRGEKEAWVKATKAAEHLPWWDVGEGIRVGKDLSIILPSRHSQPSHQLNITLLQVPTHAFLTKRAKPSSDWQLGYILPLKHIALQDLSLDSFFLQPFLNSSLGTFSNSREIPPQALIDLKNQIRSKRSN